MPFIQDSCLICHHFCPLEHSLMFNRPYGFHTSDRMSLFFFFTAKFGISITWYSTQKNRRSSRIWVFKPQLSLKINLPEKLPVLAHSFFEAIYPFPSTLHNFQAVSTPGISRTVKQRDSPMWIIGHTCWTQNRVANCTGHSSDTCTLVQNASCLEIWHWPPSDPVKGQIERGRNVLLKWPLVSSSMHNSIVVNVKYYTCPATCA